MPDTNPRKLPQLQVVESIRDACDCNCTPGMLKEIFMDDKVTQADIERFKILYENYKDKIDEVLELARLYQLIVAPKKEG